MEAKHDPIAKFGSIPMPREMSEIIALGRQEGRSNLEPPQLGLPNGGGAIPGIGEKFAANPGNGTGTMSVPIHASSGRGGFGPHLSLTYDTGRGNSLFGFGKMDESRIADPADKSRIFSWLLCENSDDRGNVVSYRYKAEDSAGVDLVSPQERNRSDLSRSAQRHLKRVLYGNRSPHFPDLNASQLAPLPGDWCFDLVFDHGEHSLDNPVPDDLAQPWARRLDPFSAYRSRFEMRTYRLCRRALMLRSHCEPTVQ
jgi:hypothetical protein